MNRKNLPSLLLFACVALLFSGCERLGNGVVQEIDFPTHTPQLAVTLISRPTTDTLVARAHTSAGILDTTGSKRLKTALFTLTHEDGASYTWGGQTDWENGIGHVLPNVELAAGLWTLQCEEEAFETATATQMVPPQIDSLGDYAYAMVTTSELKLRWKNTAEGDVTKYFVNRKLDLGAGLARSFGRSVTFLSSKPVPM